MLLAQQPATVTLPVWAQWAIAIAALVTALYVVWTKVLRPLARLINDIEEITPLLASLKTSLVNVPDAFNILKDIIAQFRNDSGSTLRDVVDRLDAAAKENHSAAEVLKVQVQVAKELAVQDRRQLDRLVTLLNYLDAKISIGTSAVQAMAESTAGRDQDVKDTLQEAQRQVSEHRDVMEDTDSGEPRAR